ncbi:DUF2235 domain-containing protein [Pseudoxanthomonas sp. SL93]|uniref:phospholipase effector Tle1 domain-containing protein n=1 Tax=Pseudoxanthomonas sp. SL93 TaxID=2995142 RepID=UPI00226FC37C|nr:DUF2235 domain-containing protein [Pseudoxanthomonas sp. SL93]WAC62211.1 DUF2235 domain-containing protein [Pseudoxanthomonas sp. SL93]
MGGERQPDGVATYPATAEDLASYQRAKDHLGGFQAPLLKGREGGRERLYVAAFDGTGNNMFKDAPENHTNVARLARQVESLKDPAIRHGYVAGPGTQGGLKGAYDLAQGQSYSSRMEDMYLQFTVRASEWLRENPKADIRVAAVGFSRGAEQAAGFTRMVEERGIRNPEGARVERDGDGRVLHVTYVGPPLREPGTVIQAVGLFDPVGTGEPRNHDRRLPPSVVSGFQITAEDERRNLFQSTRVLDPGVTDGGRFLNVTVAGAHSNIGGSYTLDGLSIRSGNLMIDYLNALSDPPFLQKREEPTDPARNVIHHSEDHQFFYRTSVYDKEGIRGRQEELAPSNLCRIDCLDAQPRNAAMAEDLRWRPVEIGPTPVAASPASMVEQLLQAAKQGDGAAIDRIGREHLHGETGQAWLQAGQQRLQELQQAVSAPAIEPQREPAALAR